MNHRLRFTSAKIAARIELVAPFVHRRSVPLAPFRLFELENAAQDPPLGEDPADWPEIGPDSYWGRPDLNFFLSGEFRVPEDWDGNSLALHLPLGTFGDIFNHPEGLVLIDGQPSGSADRFHHTITLDPSLADNRRHALGLHGWTGHTQWPPDPGDRAKLRMGRPALVERHLVLLEFIELARAALDTATVPAVDGPVRAGLLTALDSAFLALDTRELPSDALYGSADEALVTLRDGIAAAGPPLDVTLHGIGHAHMDIAYLWTVGQIRRKAVRTFSNVLRLMDSDAGFSFSHSQPQIYDFCARDAPELFRKIRGRIREGRWETIGGMWVEPDMNLPGAEALIRQIQLGRGYFRETFGAGETPVLWLPDTFGFPGQTPQLMKKSGLKWFCTNKLNWNQVTRVPPTHHWEGIDGTRVLAHVLTTPRDVEYLPFPTNYKSDLSAREILGTVTGGDADALSLPICFGHGDGGGGPTEEQLARARACRAMPGMPRFRYSTVDAAFKAIECENRPLPVHRGEHYLEGHRGTLTSQAWIKRANRKNERALHEAEALSAMAGLAPDLDGAWKLLCRNQFHDILAGTAVPEVFADARADHGNIASLAEQAASAAAAAISQDTEEILVLNTAPVASDRIAEVPAAAGEIPCRQSTPDGALVFLPALPAYSAMPLSQASARPPDGLTVSLTDDGAVLQNRFLRADIDRSGRLRSAADRATGAEILAPSSTGNQFQAFEDRPICWDAWDIDPGYEDRMDLIEETAEMAITEQGPVRAAVRIRFRWRESDFTQDIRLCAHSPRIDFVTRINWRQRHTLLKTAFPVAVQSPAALYDIQWGAVSRATTRDTPHDFARFEVPAHKWAMLSSDSHGVALLNDCKYGHDILHNVMRLTLIKSSTAPDPQADQCLHEFTYSLLPFQGRDRSPVDAAAYDLNTPLRIAQPPAGQAPVNERRAQPFVRTTGARAICETLKPAGGGAILRLFEPDGRRGRTTLHFGPKIESAWLCSLLDEPQTPLAVEQNKVTLELRPFEIITLLVRIESRNQNQ